MSRSSQLDRLSSVYFDRKTLFSVSQDLNAARSQCFTCFVSPESEKWVDVWSIKAPDFTPKLYRSLTVPQTKSRATHPAVTEPHSRMTDGSAERVFTKFLVEVDERTEPPKFVTSYKPPDALQSKTMFVKTGKHHSGSYKNPKPHNFRPLDEGLPNIVTASKRDPGNLDFKSKHLDIIQTARSQSSDFSTRDNVMGMITYKPSEPTWESRLILPKLPWPPKSASYTRHRRRRGAYSAFMDRVEEKLSRSWKNQ